MLEHLLHVNTWFPKYEADLAEQTYYTVFSQKSSQATAIKAEPVVQASLSDQLRDVRKLIVSSEPAIVPLSAQLTAEERLAKLEKSHEHILQMLDELKRRVNQLEAKPQTTPSAKAEKVAAPAPAAAADDDDDDLFASDDEEQSAETKKRLADYVAKKATKTQIIAKSSILLDIKPWDDETDLQEMEKSVRSIQTDGLIWGQSKLVPVAFGVKKLQINCVVEDDKVGTDFLEEKICEFEDFVQSVDIAAFNKI